MTKLFVGSCFSGIGGLELGLEWTGGFETRWQIENDEYASRVLAKHWPNVKRYSDIRDVVRPEPVDLICGGFPCQDVSLAGQRKGLEGKRSTLWSEMFRLVCEVKPRWVVAENVPGLLSSDGGRFFGNILRDLASAGYDAEWGVLSAAGVGAPHLRRRVFILAHPQGNGMERRSTKSQEPSEGEEIRGIKWEGKDVADTELVGWKARANEERNCGNSRSSNQSQYGSGQWAIEPNVGRVAHGVPSRMDRLKCLGNAVVPQVAQKIGEMILKIDDCENRSCELCRTEDFLKRHGEGKR